MDLVAGALLGLAFKALYETVKRISTNVRSCTIKQRLHSLGSKLEVLSIKFNGFDDRYPDFGLKAETLKLRELLEKANALVMDSVGLRWWHLRWVCQCSERLNNLNASLEDFMKVDLRIAEFSHILAIEARIVERNKKLDDMYVPKVASFRRPNGPLQLNGGDGDKILCTLNRTRTGLRTDVYYERKGK